MAVKKVFEAPFVRTPYNYDRNAAGDEDGLRCEDCSLTDQSMSEEADINVIVERFGVTGELPQNIRMPLSDEFVDIMDYRSALDKLREADEAFMKLPPGVRQRFGNDAGEFVSFASDPANLEECRRLGLAPARATEKPSEPVSGSEAGAGAPGGGTPPG